MYENSFPRCHVTFLRNYERTVVNYNAGEDYFKLFPICALAGEKGHNASVLFFWASSEGKRKESNTKSKNVVEYPSINSSTTLYSGFCFGSKSPQVLSSHTKAPRLSSTFASTTPSPGFIQSPHVSEE